MNILYVCTANLCRSKSAAVLLADAAAGYGLGGIDVQSAGSATEPGLAACTQAPALQNRSVGVSQPLDPALIDWADLVLAAARENQAAVTAMTPAARPKSFTILQAGRLADWLVAGGMIDAARWRAHYPQDWAARFAEGDPRAAVQPMPATADQQDRWFVEELDASRGLAPHPSPQPAAKPARWWRRSEPDPVNVDDVPDAHVDVTRELHAQIDTQIRAATASLARALAAVRSVSSE